jgi:hypothetical protein
LLSHRDDFTFVFHFHSRNIGTFSHMSSGNSCLVHVRCRNDPESRKKCAGTHRRSRSASSARRSTAMLTISGESPRPVEQLREIIADREQESRDCPEHLERLSVHPALGCAFTASGPRVERGRRQSICGLVADLETQMD